MIWRQVQVPRHEAELRRLIEGHVRTTQSRCAERILRRFDLELPRFWRVVPKEMLDKLAVPVTVEAATASDHSKGDRRGDALRPAHHPARLSRPPRANPVAQAGAGLL